MGNRKPFMAENSHKNSHNKAAHLKKFRWPKGVSGNVGGRPKKRPISERYAIVAEIPLPEHIRRRMGLSPGATYAHAGALGIFLAAIKGRPGAAREIREAIEGKAPQRVDVVSEDRGPIRPSLAETVERIREFYGLSPGYTKTQDPAKPDLVSAGADREPDQIDHRIRTRQNNNRTPERKMVSRRPPLKSGKRKDKKAPSRGRRT